MTEPVTLETEERLLSPSHRSAWWEPLAEFATHSVLGTGIFFIIFAPALGLNLLIHRLSHGDISPWLAYAASATEMMLVVVDLTLYAVFLFQALKKAVRQVAEWAR